jgi:hypothetical protein
MECLFADPDDKNHIEYVKTHAQGGHISDTLQIHLKHTRKDFLTQKDGVKIQGKTLQ